MHIWSILSTISYSIINIAVMIRTRAHNLLQNLPKLNFQRKHSVGQIRSTAASGSQIYDTARAVNEYLLFHYGDITNEFLQMPYAFGPRDALRFTSRSSIMSLKNSKWEDCTPSGRALDIGCSVGGMSFELARTFTDVVGIDFSQHFIDAANDMKMKGKREYEILKQGQIFQSGTAEVDPQIDRTRVRFLQGDACNLTDSLGKFDVIVASNLLCRLPKPREFILKAPALLNPGGRLVLISPYSWLEEYTQTEDWFGGAIINGTPVDSFDALSKFIVSTSNLKLVHREDIPFLIREHERKFQYGVSDCTIWEA